VIRVFPRRTKWTPGDALAFVGDPPLFRPREDLRVMISVAFTWDIYEARRLAESWGRFYSHVEIGGPALDHSGGLFVPGAFLKEGAVITSRGCIRKCAFCFVPEREGGIRELPIEDGWNIFDNNLLACSRRHIEAVFAMLGRQSKGAVFSGGLDARLFDEWHMRLLEGISLNEAWFACDYPGAERHLEKVATVMAGVSIEKKRCFVLIGHGSDTLAAAERRLERVYKMGFLPFAMLYRDSANTAPDRPWRALQRKWARPAAYRSSEARK